MFSPNKNNYNNNDLQAFAEAERQRRARGDQSIVALLGNAYYDVLDEDGDNLVSLPELKRMMNVFRVPEEAAYTFFHYADKVSVSVRIPYRQKNNRYKK